MMYMQMADSKCSGREMPRELGEVAQALAPGQFESILCDASQFIGPMTEIEVVQGGLVHHVLRVVTEDHSAYIKIRGNHFSRMPQIATQPERIGDEARALRILGKHAPEHIPQVLRYNPGLSYMLLTDVLPGASNLARQYRDGGVERSDIWCVGRALGAVHKKTQDVTNPVRTPDDTQFQATQFNYVFSPDSKELREIAQEHARSAQQVILGDVWPKNILAKDGQVGFCDLEHAFLGTLQYDQAALIASVMLHGRRRKKAHADVSAVVDGYAASHDIDASNELLCNTIAGFLLYRLEERVPYDLPYPQDRRAGMAANIRELFGRQLHDVGYIVDNLFKK